MSRRAGIALVLCAAVAALAPTLAGARGSLGPTVQLLRPTLGATAFAASSPNGYEAFTWSIGSPPPTGYLKRAYVQARLRLPDGRLTPIETISPTGGLAYWPVIGADRAGDATVAWLQHVGGRFTYAVEVSVRPAGKRFSAPVALAQIAVSTCRGLHLPCVEFGGIVAIAVAADGAAVVAWQAASSIGVAERPAGHCPARAARACFSATQVLPPGLQPSGEFLAVPGASPTLVFGSRDTAYLAYAGLGGLEVAVASARRRFAVSQIPWRADTFYTPTIALAGGDAVIAWAWTGWKPPAPLPTTPGVIIPSGVDVAARDRAGAISTPVGLPAAPGTPVGYLYSVNSPTVLVDPHGRAVIDWSQGPTIAEAVRAADGTISATSVVGTFADDQSEVGHIVMDGHGNEVLAYDEGIASTAEVQMRPAGGTFGDPLSLGRLTSGSFLVRRNRDVETIGWTTDSGNTLLRDIRPAAP